MLPNFWDDRKKSQAVFDELNTLKRNYEAVTNLKDEIESNMEMIQLLKDAPDVELQ